MADQFLAPVPVGERIPALLRWGVRDAFELAADLQLGPVVVRWWKCVPAGTPGAKCENDDTAGWILQSVTDEINLVMDAMRGEYLQAKETALHELRHLHQTKHGRYRHDEAAELDCEAYVFQKMNPSALWQIQIIDPC